MYCAEIIVFSFLIYIQISESISEQCHQLGTPRTIRESDHVLANGTCVCHPHVIGQYCDACAPGYYGLWRGAGCLPCNRHCDKKGTLPMGKSMLQCNTLGRCLCRDGYFGARCEEKISPLELSCEICKANCYKESNKCTTSNPCYSLVQEKYDEYIKGKRNRTLLEIELEQTMYNDLENKIKELLAKIVEPPNKDLDEKLNKYYKEIDSIKKQLRDYIDRNNLSNLDFELNKKLEKFDTTLSELMKNKEAFRQKLQTVATSSENSNLAKLVNDIMDAKKKVIGHVKAIQKIANETNQTCLQTCKLHEKLDASLKYNLNILKELKEKLIDWEVTKMNSTKLLQKFNDMCNDINDIKIPQYENEQSEKYIKDLDEKLRLYQKADKLLHDIKDSDLDKILKSKQELEETIKNFDNFIKRKEEELEALTSFLNRLKQPDMNFSKIEERLEKIKKNITNYMEKNKTLLESLQIFLALTNTDDELDKIEREIELLTLEFEYIIEMSLELQSRLENAKMKLEKEFTEFQNVTRGYEKDWKEDEKRFLDLMKVYDFIMLEIATEENLAYVVEDMNEAENLLEATHEKMHLDVELSYLKNTKAKLDELTVSPSEICGAKTGDSEQ